MKTKSDKKHDRDEYDYLETSSAQDCTGLIPAAPANGSEIENYEQLYPFLPKAVTLKDSLKDSAKASQEE